MKLSDAKSGDWLKVLAIEHDCDEYACKLEAMGLRKGDMIKVLNKSFFGPVQIEVNGAKIALCRAQAKKIDVEKI